jgi:hypothetical protein
MSNAAEDLGRISAMARVLLDAQQAVNDAEDSLNSAKAEQRRIEQEDFPELLREVGLTEVKLEDGTKIKLVDDVSCGISEANRPAAHAWLRARSFGGLIKTVLSVKFGKDEEAKMKDARAALVKLGYEPDVGEGVHPQTLKSFIKEQREKGASPPEQLFGIHPFSKAVVKLPK